jgi:glucose-1-phosphate thymidylyltransferase
MPTTSTTQRRHRKGVILAGGTGTRLYPMTIATNKQLLPVYDKPMIYYPLTTLMLSGIRDIVIVSSTEALPQFEACLGNGEQWGIRLSYVAQPAPDGIAHGLLVASDRIAGHPVALILGDNIFYRTGFPDQLRKVAARDHGATIFCYHVPNPEQFGVVVLDSNFRPIALEEKPKTPRSKLAVPGLYFYDNKVLEYIRTLKKSARGELEITDLNKLYLERGELSVEGLGRGSAWLDGGTPEQLYEATQFVRIIEERTGLKIACPEEIAFRMKFITREQLKAVASKIRPSEYRSYVEGLLLEDERS